MKKSLSLIIMFMTIGLYSFKPQDKETGLSIPFEKYTLPNGLTVVLNVDKSDPIAALAVYYHCLLYTSPSPRDGLLSRMPSSA